MLEHLDACAETLRAAGLPCTQYQMWLDDEGLVHYWFGYLCPLTELEAMRADSILDLFFKGES